MEQSSNDAAAKGVQIEPNREECVYDMVQRSHDAAGEDAPTMPK